MISLDLDLIISSPDLGDFERMVELWPGAMKVYKFWQRVPCDCGLPDCSRKAMQYHLKAIFEGNKDQCMKFIALIDKAFEEPITQENYYWAIEQMNVPITQAKINKALWEVYGGGSLEHMIPQGQA